MFVISVLLIVIFSITCLLLILMVLVQDEQGEGIGGIFGGGSSTPFGSRSGNVLTKFTSILAALFIIISLGLAWIHKTSDKNDIPGSAYKSAGESSETVEWWNPNTKTADDNSDSENKPEQNLKLGE